MNKNWIYLSGVVAFGLAYSWLKTLASDPIFFSCTIGYLLLLGLVAEKLGG